MEANMRPIAILAMVSACAAAAACAPIPPPGVAAPGQAAGNPPLCQTATVPLTVGGRPEQATIEACPQPDGSWLITQTTPGLPPQVYVMPAPPPGFYPSAYPDYGDYFDYWPYWAAAPWFWGIGPTVVVVQHFHHFHHFAHAGPGFDHAMPHGFGHAVAAAGGHR
jgi:hypothetical protein